jgi:prepilin-type N-terminal cleavage/methylation domain-containing protein
MRRTAAGFTLVEITITMLIGALLFWGILKAQELVDSARTRGLADDFRTIRVAFYAYQDRFHALPGDHRLVGAAMPAAISATTPAGSLANGRIDGAWDSTTVTDESYLVWQHLRLAGYIAGAIDPNSPDYLPRNSIGTRVGLSSSMQITNPPAVTGGHNVCATDVPGSVAKRLDVYLDDGDTAAGSLRAASPAAPTIALANSAIADGGKYIVCMAI